VPNALGLQILPASDLATTDLALRQSISAGPQCLLLHFSDPSEANERNEEHQRLIIRHRQLIFLKSRSDARPRLGFSAFACWSPGAFHAVNLTVGVADGC